ncbi:peroxidase P7-like [Canna indica]|uniref:Peroxidase n=1 Tax=Canna indica TaxID=4628 RepID=A0AAQ3QH03_9LILI|nr:peroxidase P7-like [Canna indica]
MAFRFQLPLFLLCMLVGAAHGQFLSPNFYGSSCPNLESIVRSEMTKAVAMDRRMGASILRLFFHDCFVNGCDASVLLDDAPPFVGEKTADPNRNSLRGYEVIDAIKASVEAACPATVSCADILALAAREGISQLGGPAWTVQLGRRDATAAANPSVANANLPFATDNLDKLISLFAGKGFSAQEMTALSGAHTVGLAQCDKFRRRIFGDADIDPGFADDLRKQNCPSFAPLDRQSPMQFDNLYYQNLVLKKGLLHSDQELFNGGSQDSVVMTYSMNNNAFRNDFAAAMEKMGRIRPLTGLSGEIRFKCNKVN